VAFKWPEWWALTETGGFDPFVATKPFLKYLFAATMFAIGGLLPPEEVRQVFRRWPTVLGGTAVQFSVMPLLAFLIAHAAGLTGDLLIGVILVGCVPGAMASNVLTLAARGNVSYSVSLTTSATVLSPFVVPFTLWLTVQESGVDKMALAKDAFIVLTTQVAGPVVAGYFCSRRFTAVRNVMQKFGPAVANLTILWIIAVIVNANHSNYQRLVEIGLSLAVILLAINLAGYLAGFGGASALRLPDGMRRAMTLEIGMQNAGLGSLMATQLFPERNLVALPPALYMFGCMLTGTILAQLWSYRTITESTPMPESEEMADEGVANS